ncbi:cyclin-dependent kinase 4-like [Uloborus diversus]|uniref:cyclin-dependent kinase 4-like n=1 Tax=Uloborus diversus TaxID=327109 RepID=UPI00240A639F|nr:cyclin-dependent kinase 4-like [Uloborus diversus]
MMPSHIAAKNSSLSLPPNTSVPCANTQQNMPPASINNPFLMFQPNTKSYEDMTLIGNGAYGTVYKAKDLANNGQFVALKKVRVPLGEDGVPVNAVREIALLKQLTSFEHPNVVRLLDICQGRKLENERQMLLYLVFEHVDQDLSTYLEKCPSPGLGPERIKDITYQLLNGLDFLHFNRVLHRDLKPQNILISNQGIVKLADFGLARLYTSNVTLTSVVVTLWYRPPEVLMAQPYGTAVDVWSCGCILAELYRRKPLFPGENEVDQLAKIFEVVGSPSQSDWPLDVSLPWTTFKFYKGVPFRDVVPEICSDGADLLKKMVCYDPVQRISCAAAMKHPYFRDFEMNPPSCIKDTLQNNTQHPKASRFYKIS